MRTALQTEIALATASLPTDETRARVETPRGVWDAQRSAAGAAHRRTKMMNVEQLNNLLSNCYGSEKRHAYLHVWLTDGVRQLADAAECWWLVDLVVSHQWGIFERHGAQPFQSWTLTRNKRGHGAVAECTDGNGLLLAKQRIPYTDFPLPSVGLRVVDDLSTHTIMMPSEY
jgi:hypothetical protein